MLSHSFIARRGACNRFIRVASLFFYANVFAITVPISIYRCRQYYRRYAPIPGDGAKCLSSRCNPEYVPPGIVFRLSLF
uniref:Uncharacterized protein n=1 Tax=Anopheles darlingi TaxID=43151 RepID=A0A2M4DP52_ANODA